MNKLRKRRITTILLTSILALAMLLSCIGIISSAGDKTADAFISTSLDSQSFYVGDLTSSHYLTSTKVFNRDMLYKLISHLSGDSNITDTLLNSLGSTPKSSQDFRSIPRNQSKDIVVTIAGKKWVATYLSQNNSGEPIVTFWLASSDTTDIMNNFSSSNDDMYPSSMYGTSWMRASVLNNGGGYVENAGDTTLKDVTPTSGNEWAIYTMDGISGSLTANIEIPDNMSWQHVQSVQNYCGWANDLNNEGLDVGRKYQTGQDFTKKTGYTNWSGDRLWIPSMAEVSYYSGNSGLWKISSNQRADNSPYSWTRSSAYDGSNTFSQYMSLGASDGYARVNANDPRIVRPAFHLKLKTAIANSIPSDIADPSNVSNPYNGGAQDLSNIPDTTKTKWYESDFIDLTYPSGMTNVGTYKVRAEIKSEFATAGVVFQGTPDTSDTAHLESNTVRWFDFVITPKQIGLVWTQDGKGIWSVAPNPDDICSIDQPNISSIIDTRYKNKPGTSTPSYDQVNNKPKTIGDYTAIAEFKDNNYSAKPSETTSKDFNLPVLKVTPMGDANFDPSSSQDYSGKNMTFLIKNYSNYRLKGDTGEADVEISVPTRFDTVIEITGGTITVKDGGKAGTYALLLTLIDPINSQWADKSETVADRNLPREVEFTIIQKTLSAQIISGLTGGIVKVADDATTATLTLEIDKHPLQSDEISIDVYAVRTGTTNEYLMASDIRIKASDKTASIYDYDVNLDLTVLPLTGDYKLKFVIDRDDQTVKADNANYILDMADIDLNVSDEVDESNVVWRLRDGKRLVGTIRTPIGTLATTYSLPNPLIFDVDKTYTFTVDLPTGYSVDTLYDNTIDGYVKGYKDATQKNANADGESYVTYVKVRDNTGNVETYSITWTIQRAKFDLSNIKWKDDGKLEFTGSPISPTVEGLPTGLEIKDIMCTPATSVGPHGSATVQFKVADAYAGNFIEPDQYEDDSYTNTGDFAWTISWEIVPVTIRPGWERKDVLDKNDIPFKVMVLGDKRVQDKVYYEYYETDIDGNIINSTPITDASQMEVSVTQTKYYKAKPVLQGIYVGNYQFPDTMEEYSPVFTVGGGASEVTVALESDKYVYNGKEVALKWAAGTPVSSLTFTYYEGETFGNKIDGTPKEAGKYWVEVTSNNSTVSLSGDTKFQFEITKNVISKEWNTTSAKPPVLRNLTSLQLRDGIEYEYYDSDMHKITFADLSKGGTFKIRAVLKDTKNFEFDGSAVETDLQEFTISAGEALQDPSDINNPHYTFDDDDNPPSGTPSGNVTGSGDNGGGMGGLNFDNVSKALKEWWQVIASVISIVLIIVFTSKGVGYANKRKKAKKSLDKYANYYAGATGLFGLAMTVWTVIACVLMGLAVLSLVYMLLQKKSYNKVQEELDDAKDTYERNKKDEEKENMRMMLMGMMGGNAGGAQGGFAYQQGLGADEIRGIVSETMTALLPGVQQMLPQQASRNDDLVERLLEKTEKHEETIEKLILKMAQQPTEKVVETVVAREVAATSTVNDETIKQMMKTQENLMQNQEKLMEKILELSADKAQPQVVEKVIEKEVPVEKIVEKVVEVPVEVEKIVEVEKEVIKEVPVEVEKVVEKEVRVEVPVEVEKIVEVEKEVIKEVKVEVPVVAPPKPKKEVAPKLTLDEAYALLSKEQKKYFDGLRAYALSKDKCKEKKSTYFTVFGQTTTNPILKLAIKKDTTVALLKMEDEFMKDLRRDASGDGTKVKVKETEIVVGDAQAFDTAKKMIDLREDQIERYADLLKEQRSVRNKK